jgi:hypothetical protein
MIAAHGVERNSDSIAHFRLSERQERAAGRAGAPSRTRVTIIDSPTNTREFKRSTGQGLCMEFEGDSPRQREVIARPAA